MADLSVGVIGAGRMGSCIQSLHSGTPVPVSTPAKPGFYQEQELQGGAHVD